MTLQKPDEAHRTMSVRREGDPGSKEAFSLKERQAADLCERYVASLHSYFRSKCVSRQDIDDLVQECLLVFWNKKAAIHPGKEDGYLFGVASRVLMAYQRNGRRQRGHEEKARLIADQILAESVLAPDVALAAWQQNGLIKEAIKCLPPRMRDVVRLHYIEGLSTADVARKLGISWTTVYESHQRAITLLRNVLAKTD